MLSAFPALYPPNAAAGARRRRAAALGATALLLAAAALPAAARIVRLEITSRTVTFEGRSFGTVGAYEKLRGKAYGEVDPTDPKNALIVDLALAPRNARGKVDYVTDIYILKPVDLSRGRHQLFMEINNRGGKLFGPFNRSAGGNDPTTAADAGDAFLFERGYSLAWNGWDPSAAAGGDRLTITVPTVKNPDGSPITGPGYEYIVNDNATTQTYALSYPAATLDPAQARLTVRDRLTDTPVEVPASGWAYTNERTIRLLPAGTPFRQSAIYEFTYTSKDPIVAGLGFAATRDFVDFLRNATTDDLGTPNPLAGDVRQVYAFTVSQPARYVNDFVWLGFNQSEGGRKVFDGVLNWIGAGTGVALNVRFSQPARTERNRQNKLYPEAFFPFAYQTLTEPALGITDGRRVRCAATATCPALLHVNSSNEYWVKAGSLLHTDLQGNDLPDPPDQRVYLLASMEHAVAGAAPDSPGICAQPRNVNDPNAALRSLFVALDEWVVAGRLPPASRVPRAADGNRALVQPVSPGVGVVSQAELGWPSIPGVLYTGLATSRNRFDWGPQFHTQGIMSYSPPQATGSTYRHYVSRVDADGNEVAGIRLPPVAAPIATMTGWAHRAAAFGGPDGCEASGQTLKFATTKAERLARGDPRLSLEERYRTHANYVAVVRKAALRLVEQRLLLPEDAERYIQQAAQSNVLVPATRAEVRR